MPTIYCSSRCQFQLEISYNHFIKPVFTWSLYKKYARILFFLIGTGGFITKYREDPSLSVIAYE